MRIAAFHGLRPRTTLVERISSPPYDVVTREEARLIARDNPLSMIRVVRAEVDLPADTGPYEDIVYTTAVKNFNYLKQNSFLCRDSETSLYLYRQIMGEHVQTGIAALCNVEDYDNDLIKRHEKTHPDKEDDRTRLTSELCANPGPVFMTYRDIPEIDQLVAGQLTDPPLFDFTSKDGIRHSVWRIPHGEGFIEAFKVVPSFYVADGHHRSASAARVGRERREANPNHTGEEDYNWFLCVLFPASQLKVLPYNRIVKDLNDLDVESFLDKIRNVCELTPDASPEPEKAGIVSMYLEGRWYGLDLGKAAGEDSVSRLDMVLLERKILAPILGIEDQLRSARVAFTGGIHGTEKLADKVDEGEAAVAFSLYPVSLDDLMAIADSDLDMPSKTTWFEPKLRTGLFIHEFEK